MMGHTDDGLGRWIEDVVFPNLCIDSSIMIDRHT